MASFPASLLLTLSMFHTFFNLSIFGFEQINVQTGKCPISISPKNARKPLPNVLGGRAIGH